MDIDESGKTPPTYDYPGQATPGYKTKIKSTPKPSPTPQGRQPNARGNLKTNNDSRGAR